MKRIKSALAFQGWLDMIAKPDRFETEISGQQGPNTWVTYRDKASLRLVTVWSDTKTGKPYLLIDLDGDEIFP